MLAVSPRVGYWASSAHASGAPTTWKSTFVTTGVETLPAASFASTATSISAAAGNPASAGMVSRVRGRLKNTRVGSTCVETRRSPSLFAAPGHVLQRIEYRAAVMGDSPAAGEYETANWRNGTLRGFVPS